MRAGSLPVDTVVFDLDGTLLDIRRRHYACYRSILRGAGFRALESGVYWRLKRRRVEQSEILRRTGSEAFEARFRIQWERRIETAGLLSLDRLQPGARRILDRLHGSPARVLVATMRRNRAAAMRQLRGHSIAPLIDAVVACPGEAGGAGKALAVRSAVPDLVPAGTVWIGDTEADADAAAAMGCRLVLMACGLRNAAFLRGLRAGPVVFGLRAIELWVL